MRVPTRVFYLVKPMLEKKFQSPSFFMVHVTGSDKRPVVKHKTLNKAMNEAARLAEEFGHSVTVMASLGRVEIINGKRVWSDVTPK